MTLAKHHQWLQVGAGLILAIWLPASILRADESTSMFACPDTRDVRTVLLHWIARAGADQAATEEVLSNWSDDAELMQLSGEQLLDLLVDSFARVDPASQRLIQSTWGSGPLEEVVYDGLRDLEIYRCHVDLYRARWLTQHRYYDEALEIYNQLSPDNVVDPAGLFFYRAVCQSELLQHEQALDSLSLLLDHTLEVPSRFRTIATILQKELGGRSDDGLDHVSRMMSDVGRRLDLGRSGKRVQQREEEVIAAIDRLLEQMENQNQQQSGSQGGNPNPNFRPSGQAAPDSRIHGAPGKGDADLRDVKETGSWGMLDRQEETRAREFIQRQFPANYLDIISEYSRRIAEQE